ncbi:MAG: zinc-binding alcohol dehydrogenase family protein [Pleomorphochaeta sp.]
MKTIRIDSPFDLKFGDMDIPTTCNEDEVIIKVTAGGICGSDIGIYNGTNSLATYPRIIGHEFGGYIKVLGNNVKNLKVGQLVAIDPVVSCGHCYACNTGHHNVCSTLEVIGVHRDGGFRQYISVPAKNVHIFKSEFDPYLVSMVEPFSIGMEINNRANIKEGDKVLIFGSGPIGLCAMQIAMSRKAKVMIADIDEKRLKKAKEMGASETVFSNKDNLEERVLKFTSNEGMPVIIDTACQTHTFEQSVKLASPAGRLVILGLLNKPSEIVMADITKKELTILGSRLNNNCFDDVIAGFENGSLHPELIKTDEFLYTDAKKAFDKVINHASDVLKVVLKFDI